MGNENTLHVGIGNTLHVGEEQSTLHIVRPLRRVQEPRGDMACRVQSRRDTEDDDAHIAAGNRPSATHTYMGETPGATMPTLPRRITGEAGTYE